MKCHSEEVKGFQLQFMPLQNKPTKYTYILKVQMKPAVEKRKASFTRRNDPPTKMFCTVPPPVTLVKTVKKPFKKFSSDLSNLPPVPAIDAFQRGYEVESILDIVENTDKKQFLLIKFKDLLEPELVHIELALERVPHLLFDFYQEYVQAWQKLNQQKGDASLSI